MMTFHGLLLAFLLGLSLAQLSSAAAIKVNSATLSIRESDGAVTDTVIIGFKDKLKKALKLDHTQKLQIVLKNVESGGQAIQPEQMMLRLRHTAAGKDVFLSAVDKDGTYGILLTSEAVRTQIGTYGGEFQATLLVGASEPEIASQWGLGPIEVYHHPGPDGNQPPAPVTLMETATSAKPEIVHMHRQSGKRAPVVISFVFALIVLAPTVVFAIGCLAMGAVPKAFPPRGIAGMYAMAFHAGVLAILLLYFVFWLGMFNLLETSPIAAGLTVITMACGIKASQLQAVSKPTKQE